MMEDFKESTYAFARALPKYIACLGILVLFIMVCIFFNIHWAYIVLCILPTTVLYWLCAKYLPPSNFDCPIEITGEYTGGDFTSEKPLFGQFGIDKPIWGIFSSPKIGLPYRTYQFAGIWLFMFPVSCLALSNEYPSYGMGVITYYKVYGKCKRYILEIIYLYLLGITAVSLLFYIPAIIFLVAKLTGNPIDL